MAVFAGSKHQVECCRQYLTWLMQAICAPARLVSFLTRARPLFSQQRTGGVSVDDKSRSDITVLPVPSRVVGFVTGARGSNLRDVEERSGTFCFTDG